MNTEKLKKIILTIFSHVTFEYNGKSCGIDPFSLTEFDIWYGDKVENQKVLLEADGYQANSLA